jgi:hypothetical protein
MLKGIAKRPTRNEADADVQRVRDEMKPRTVAAGGRAASLPESMTWFDGEKSRRPFCPRVDGPDSDTYLPPPLDAESAAAKKKKILRRRQLS